MSSDEEMAQIDDAGIEDSQASAAAPSSKSEMQIDTRTRTEADEDFSQADLNRLVEEHDELKEDENYDGNQNEAADDDAEDQPIRRVRKAATAANPGPD